ncbi:MAG: S41 family peptidase [Chitinophagaceae bacterium]
MCDTITWKLDNDKYDVSLNAHEFAFEITKDLQRVSNDLHIIVTPPVFNITEDDKELTRLPEKKELKIRSRRLQKSRRKLKTYQDRMKEDMFQYGDIKILPGNIGYAEIKAFTTTAYNRKDNKNRIRFEEVMVFLANTETLILDLRNNNGGYLSMAAYAYSFFAPQTDNYFLTAESHNRYDSQGVWKEAVFAKEYTVSKNAGYDNAVPKKIFILTSTNTFSAAESIAYKIRKYRPHTVIVGEKTKGGGNALNWTKFERFFSAEIPDSRVFDKMNNNYELEARGVVPDTIVPADSAYAVAYRLAISDMSRLGDKTRFFHKEKGDWQNSRKIDIELYPDYLGDYRKMQILEEAGKLILIYDQMPGQELISLTKDHFQAVQSRVLIHFLRNKNDRVFAIEVKSAENFTEVFRKL